MRVAGNCAISPSSPPRQLANCTTSLLPPSSVKMTHVRSGYCAAFSRRGGGYGEPGLREADEQVAQVGGVRRVARRGRHAEDPLDGRRRRVGGVGDGFLFPPPL